MIISRVAAFPASGDHLRRNTLASFELLVGSDMAAASAYEYLVPLPRNDITRHHIPEYRFMLTIIRIKSADDDINPFSPTKTMRSRLAARRASRKAFARSRPW